MVAACVPRHVFWASGSPEYWRLKPPERVKPKRLLTGTIDEKLKPGVT